MSPSGKKTEADGSAGKDAGNDRKLKAIFFDVDDTLYDTSTLSEKARRAGLMMMQKAGLKADMNLLWREMEEIIVEFTSNHPQHFDRLLQRIPKNTYKNVNPAVLVAAGVVGYHNTKIKELLPYEDVVEALKRLSKLDLTLGIISAGLTIKQAEKIVRLGILPYFTPQAIYISDQIGISKPNPKLYLRVCSDLNLSPAQCMYVGDNPLNDIDPPNKIGMITVRNRRGGKYSGRNGETNARYEIHNFWDLLDILRRDFGFDPGE